MFTEYRGRRWELRSIWSSWLNKISEIWNSWSIVWIKDIATTRAISLVWINNCNKRFLSTWTIFNKGRCFGCIRVGLRHQGWESATSRNGSDVRVGSVHWCDARNGSLPHHSYGFIIKKRILKMSITE